MDEEDIIELLRSREILHQTIGLLAERVAELELALLLLTNMQVRN